MTPDDWTLLAEGSRALVHHASLLMGVLTDPARANDRRAQAPLAQQAADSVAALLAALRRAPELTAHLRSIQKFEGALAAWRRAIVDGSALVSRYQTALLQQAAQVVTAGLHVAALAASESARELAPRYDTPPPPEPPTP